jgi:hypothetical protein
VPDDPSFDWSSTDSFTIEVWANFTNVSTKNKVMIGRDEGGGSPHWWLGASVNTGVAKFNLVDTNGNGVAVSGGPAINDGYWHHLVAVRDESLDENRLYVDGALVDWATHDYTAGFEASTTLDIAYMAYNGTPDYFYDGLLDEIALYQRALTEPEIEQHYDDALLGYAVCREPEVPSITSTPVLDASVGQLYTYDVDATGHPAPTYSLIENPDGMTINAATGVIEWTPAAEDVGGNPVTVKALNSAGEDQQSFTIQVSPGPVCPEGMTSYWRLNEVSSGSYADSVDGNHGICGDAACPSPTPTGQVDGAQLFSVASNTGIDIPADVSFDWGAGDSFSVEYWMITDPSSTCSGNQVLVGRDDGATQLHWWTGCYDGGDPSFIIRSTTGESGDDGVLRGITDLTDGFWHHIVAVKDGDDLLLYVDGDVEDSSSFAFTAGFDSATAAINIGWLNLSAGYNFDGTIDEVAVYNRALKEYEIEYHYASGQIGEAYCEDDLVAPTIISTAPVEATAGELYTYDVDAVGNPAPTYALDIYPTGMTIDPSTGLIEWTPDVGQAGLNSVTVRATNSEGDDTEAFDIDVTVPPPCPADMTHYWKLDDTAAPYEDFYGDNDATCSFCPTPATGIVDGAQQFDGLDDEVDVADDDTFDWGASDTFSIEFWMNSDSDCSGNEVIVGRDDASSNLHWWVGCADTGDEALFVLIDRDNGTGGSGSWPSSGMDITDGSWHHIVAVKDPTHIRVYVDGEHKEGFPKSYTAGFDGVAPINLGYLNLSGHYRYEGLLDQVALYDRALDSTEIEDHYNNGLGKDYCEECSPPVISTQPQSQTVCEGDNAQFTISATGSGTLHYAWYMDTTPVGTDSPTLTLVNVQMSDDGAQITCDVTDDCDTVTSDAATLNVNPVPTATASNDGPICEGDDVQLTGGPDAMDTYSWTGPGGYTSDQQSPLVPAAEAGDYCLTVTLAGCTSQAACTTVVVNPGQPVIDQQPNDVEVCEGEDGICTIVAHGTGTLHYSWLLDSQPVGTDSDTLVLPDMQLEDDGSEIRCIVSDDCGLVMSDSAWITVHAMPIGDISGDCVVDLDDYALFAACMGGPDESTPPGGCSTEHFERADMENDNDVDLADFALFETSYPTG